jgi:hypothetical protein
MATAMHHHPDATLFLTTQPGAEALVGIEPAAVSECWHVVSAAPNPRSRGASAVLMVAASGGSWNPRCGLMALGVFIQLFLNGGIGA